MKILYVTSRFPWPLDKGDKLRAFNQIRHLSEEHEISLFSISQEIVQNEWIEKVKPYCARIEVFHLSKKMIVANIAKRLFSSLPFQCIFFYNERIANALSKYADVILPDKIVFQLIRTTEYARLFKRSDCVIDLMDCFSYHYFLRSKSSTSVSRWFYDREYRRIKRYETSILKIYKNAIIISKKDKSLLPGDKRNVQVIGNGVELPKIDPTLPKRCDLLFLGNLHYRPNIEAARFLVNEILPLLRVNYPSMSVIIAGFDAKKKLGLPVIDNVQVIENIENTLPVFQGARVFVAPMFLSTGIQNKILEAMASGVPVITTPNAADALGVLNGQQLLTAVSAPEFRDQVSRILHEPGLAKKLSGGARDFVAEHCNWTENNNLLRNVLFKNSTISEAAQHS